MRVFCHNRKKHLRNDLEDDDNSTMNNQADSFDNIQGGIETLANVAAVAEKGVETAMGGEKLMAVAAGGGQQLVANDGGTAKNNHPTNSFNNNESNVELLANDDNGGVFELETGMDGVDLMWHSGGGSF